MKISAQGLERGKELYDDPIFRSIVDKVQTDTVDFHCNVVHKYVLQLQKHGLSEAEAGGRLMGVVIAQSMQGLHEIMEGYTKDKLMQIVSDTYDLIHMEVTDEEMLGGKKPS